MGWGGIARPTRSIASGGGGRLRAGPRPTLNAFDANTQTGVTLMRFDGVLAFIER